MRSTLSLLASRFFGVPLLGLSVAIGAGALKLGELAAPASVEGGRAAILDDPEHQKSCLCCQLQSREAIAKRPRRRIEVPIELPPGSPGAIRSGRNLEGVPGVSLQ
ncbi:hypothetical protein [Tautonia sociabilis]|uniref:Uncharacterized protein n=1 Tax=Tautonia sociabilis TaxID=2080755 RepID=A0A432MNG7_9BACT|nr:hypothetical protein [Tautonia sociabilis]RUL88984.1 hypothetical protein TsocGM_03735 [Tautonia sociabilis]